MPERLSAFPPELSTRPELTRSASPIQRFAQLPTLSYAAGLYSQGAMLYLLGRQKGAWYLYAIDPERDRLAAPGVRLPTSASHLNVVPSDTARYFVERGPVGDHYRQEIGSMLVVNASSLSTLASLSQSCPTLLPVRTGPLLGPRATLPTRRVWPGASKPFSSGPERRATPLRIPP